MVRWLFMLGFAAACSGGGPAPEAAKPGDAAGEGTCSLSLDGLAGKTFVRVTRAASGAREEDLAARVQFYDDGGKLKAKYTARSLSDVYVYGCSKTDKEVACWQEDVRVADFCRALVANGKECTPEAVAELTGTKVEAIKAKVDETITNVKALKGADLHKMKEVFSSPSNPLRGVLKARVRPKDCVLSVSDLFQAMTGGQLKEVENVVGTSNFVETDRPLVFENCADGRSLLVATSADAKPDAAVSEATAGQPLFARYIGSEHVKAEPDCAYTMDTWVAYERLAAGQPVQPDATGKLDWAFQASFKGSLSYPGVLHMYRYRKCGDKAQELVGVTCAAVRVP